MTPSYDLKSVQLPRLAGPALALFVSLVENPLTRGLLLPQLLKSGGIRALRSLLVDEPPTFQPPVPPAEQPQAAPGPYLEALEALSAASPAAAKGFAFHTAGEYAATYRSGAADPVAVAERLLQAIADSQQNGLGIFVAWEGADLLRQARDSAQRIREGRPLSPLDGVPVAIKDELDMRPFGTSVGTRFLGKQPAAEDSTVVARLRLAGALLLGKVNMHEIGIGVTGQNPHHGTARNPYNPGHHTGGSSSGSAAAVAAGFCPIAIGADGGGSIRIPASLCGVVGLKPTYGRVSELGAAPLDWSVAHVGPLAATARDLALGYAAIAGPDPRDANTLHQPTLSVDDFENLDLHGLVLGVYWPWFRHASPEVVSACEALLHGLEGLGARLQEIEIPGLEAARVAHVIIITSEMNAGLERYYAAHRGDYSLEVRLNLALARSFTPNDYLQAQRIRTRLVAAFQGAFAGVDAILTPASAIAAPPIRPEALAKGESDLSQLTEIMRYATPANLTGHPAIAFPAGYTPQGLPVGLQAIGRYWHEHTLLRLAHAAEQLVERQKPQVYYETLAR